MIKLFFDIETIPSAEENKEAYVELMRKKKTHKTKEEDEVHASMSFDGTFGRIVCIGVIKENGNKIIQQEVFKGTEKEVLTKFWETSRDVHRFVGHNVWGFDMPFILQRSIINGVQPLAINFRRYQKDPLYDTMLEWNFWSFDKDKMHSLDTLAKVLGFPSSKADMDGSMVWDYYQKGKIDEICKYCMKDVELTRKVYYKMTFEEPADDTDPTLF